MILTLLIFINRYDPNLTHNRPMVVDSHCFGIKFVDLLKVIGIPADSTGDDSVHVLLEKAVYKIKFQLFLFLPSDKLFAVHAQQNKKLFSVFQKVKSKFFHDLGQNIVQRNSQPFLELSGGFCFFQGALYR